MKRVPRLLKIQRTFAGPTLGDVPARVAEEIQRLLHASAVRPGQTIAVCVGSRGIAELPVIVESAVRELKQAGLQPFLVPAMGSHGGATAAGQTDVLKKLGIQPEKWQVEVRAEMSTDLLGETSQRLPIHFSRMARQADHVLLCNRIKPHTSFMGPVQSGLQKMLVIGLGKQSGAAACHRASHHISFAEIIREAVPLICRQVSVLGGLAILENAQEKIAHLEAIPAAEIAAREPELLNRAESLMPRLPVREMDLLIIDEIGKEISGTGMDTNIVGRKTNDHVSGPEDWCQSRLIYVRGLTEATAGNATGIGMAEFTHPGVVKQVDWQKTAINSLTAGHPTAAMCPVVLENDRAVLSAVHSIVGEELRIVHLRNTLQLETLYVSENCRDEVLAADSHAICSPPQELTFNSQGWFAHTFQTEHA